MHFKIHNQGWIYFISCLFISIIVFFFSPFFSFLILILTFYIYYFFRDPPRNIPFEDVIISPADGVITYIGESVSPFDKVDKARYLKISIFLNIFNVHVNRLPTSGLIKNIEYIPGKFINATLDKSSLENERNIVLIQKENKDNIYVIQIAGLIARRIICEIKTNQKAIKGYRFGIIKFGSRVDLYMPSHYKPLVTLGQTVIGGETIMSNPNNILELTKSLKN